MPKLQRWTGKGTAYRIWTDINKYIESYTSKNPHKLESSWFKKWYNYYHISKIGDETLPLPVAAIVITGNPHASIYDCVKVLFNLIPNLQQHLIVQEIGKNNGNIRYYLNEYGFQTPSRTASPASFTESQVRPANTTISNRFALLQNYELNDDANDDEFTPSPSKKAP